MTNIKDTRLYESFNCKICNKKCMRCSKKRSGRHLPEGVMRSGAITCCKDCSIRYAVMRER